MSLVDVIIPVYKPEKEFAILIKRLQGQSLCPGKIIMINTDREEWEKRGMDALLQDALPKGPEMVLRHIEKKDFDHGAARNFGASLSDAKYFVCMTQDAIPCDRELLRFLLRGMDERVKLTYARQIPKRDAGLIESFTRHFNYPEQSLIKSLGDQEKMGIKIFFASNVCAAYEREAFEALGGFPEGNLLNEDMLYAGELLFHHYFIKYEAWARVYHSHQYSGWQQFRRNFDIGASQVMNPHVFGRVNSQSEGIRLVKETAGFLHRQRAYLHFFPLLYLSGCKYLGHKLGRSYQRLPLWLTKKLSMDRKYWEKNHVPGEVSGKMRP